jgi:ComF family protein
MIRDFISLIYPRICASCGNSLWKKEEVICTFCHYHLPKTSFHLEEDNPVSRLFWGRVNLEGAAAFLSFNKGSRVQKLIHQLKYKGRKDIGISLGYRYGQLLVNSPVFSSVSVIVPVPLHPKKLQKRGYNQSEQVAIGLADAMKIPFDKHTLVRIKATETQTRKSRFHRWENVKEIFSVTEPGNFINQHILLVDDVITTGATLESCIMAIASIPGCKVSVAALATALI